MCLVLCGHTQRKGFNGEYGSSFSGGFELSLVILTLGMVRPVRVGEPLYCWPCLPFFPCRLRGECECGVGEGEGVKLLRNPSPRDSTQASLLTLSPNLVEGIRLPPLGPHQPLRAIRAHVPLQLTYSTAFSEDGSHHGWKRRPWSLTAQMPTLAFPLTHCVMGGEPLNLFVGQLPYPIYRHDNSLYFTEDEMD